MIKVAMIGAGSVVFSRNLTGDILSFPEFKDATFSYMDIDADRLHVGAALCRKVGQALGANPKIEATLDRKQALAGADFVINMVQIGGFDSTLIDFEIPRRYGLNFTIADTTGPGGLFRALRTFPMLRSMCRDMMELCPRAILLQYSNPMSMNMQTVFRTTPGVRAVGLCHSVQGTLDTIMRYIGQDPREVAFTCAGINHMAFYTRLENARGEDLYPRLFEAMKRPEVYNSNKVRFELMKRFGYFVTESSEHNAEYSSYFIPHGRQHCASFGVPIDEYLRRCDSIVHEFDRLKTFAGSDEPITVQRSHEYGSTIIHAVATGTPAVIYGNMPNRGAIANLPDTAIAEAPTLLDRSGLRFTTVGELPPQLIGYMSPHVAQHELFIRAAMEGRRDHVYQAAMLDPLTAATMPPDKIVEMCDELIAAHGFEKDGGCLPDLDAKRTLVPTSGKSFPRTDAHELRKSWDDAQVKCAADYLVDWHIIGPFKSPTPCAISLDQRTAIDEEFDRRGDGSIDVRASKWNKARASTKTGMVNFARELGKTEYCLAYGYTEIESIHAREVVLRCGSDDGIQIWINGEVVHRNEIGRAYVPDSDAVTVSLRAGINRIFVKIDNYIGGYGFGIAIPKANF